MVRKQFIYITFMKESETLNRLVRKLLISNYVRSTSKIFRNANLIKQKRMYIIS